MSLRSALIASLAIPSLLILGGCGDKPKKKAEQNVVKIKGDPKAFVRHTANNTTSTILESGLDFASEWTLSISGFESVSRRKGGYEEAKASQDPSRKSAAPERDGGIAGEGYRFIKNGDGTVSLVSKADNAVKFVFQIENGVLDLRKVEIQGRVATAGEGFELVHYSSSPENDAHSLLLYQGKVANKQLISFTFRKVEGPASVVEEIKEAYYYMFGKGVKLGWRNDRPLELQMCQPALPSLNKMFDEGLKQWQKVLAGRLELRRGTMEKCPPFSDVNTQTVVMVDEWIEVHGGDVMSAGQTLVEASKHRARIEDADIFILLAEWDEYLQERQKGNKLSEEFIEYGYFGDSRAKKLLQRTMTHEIGHALGLHHQFDGEKSIMSYDADDTELADYDRRAIQALYPVNPALPQRQLSQPASPWAQRNIGDGRDVNPHPVGSTPWAQWEIDRINREYERGRELERLMRRPYGG